MRELIYKDEAYKAIDNCIRDGWDRISPADAKMNIHYLISESVIVNTPLMTGRPQGKWIEVDDSLISCKCSICDWESHMHEDDVYGMPYCPNCGAQMKEVDYEISRSH